MPSGHSVRGRKLTDWHVPGFLKISRYSWDRYKQAGLAPRPDGKRSNAHNGRLEDFWYEDTLWDWRNGKR